MTSPRILHFALITAAAMLYWLAVALGTGVREPWDSAIYWTIAYPLSLAMAALSGFVLRRHAWLAAILITFAQFPVMMLTGGAGTLWMAGVLILIVLSLPAIVIAAMAAFIARRVQSRTSVGINP